MRAAGSSEMPVIICQTTWYHFPEENSLASNPSHLQSLQSRGMDTVHISTNWKTYPTNITPDLP
jgi:hypothetical protein